MLAQLGQRLCRNNVDESQLAHGDLFPSYGISKGNILSPLPVQEKLRASGPSPSCLLRVFERFYSYNLIIRNILKGWEGGSGGREYMNTADSHCWTVETNYKTSR